MENRKELIEQYEEEFAWDLASQVFTKPQVSVWMILIPIILVFHMYRHQQYVDGRRSFVQHYLVTRRKMLAEAMAALRDKARVDLDKIGVPAEVPEEARAEYRAWVKLLVDYYRDLLSAEGGSFHDLVRSAYHNRSNYLLILNQLNTAEVRFNAALKPQLAEDTGAVDETISRIENSTRTLRRASAYRIFS